jgi:beta-lactamase regulating signal transducer with metallopeptidase domain/tetratricopeptide (TPR) repeat protein/protocatechuate 3,4-dioxygenase beta subunit
MTRFAESYGVWLADYYLLATVLLALALSGIVFLKQPAQRLMVTKSTFAALVLLAILCAVPGWSVVHLLTADRPTKSAEPIREEPMAVSDAAERPDLTQSKTIQRGAAPVLAPQTADEVVTKPNASKTSWAASLAIAHLVGMGCIVVWLALGWLASIRLRRAAQAAPAHVCAILDELATLNSPRAERLRLFTHDRIDVAVALGVWRPMIMLPTRWTSSQSQDRLRAVLAHESTHVLNHDLQWVALARILFIALWANPLFLLAKRRLRLDQEALADAAAAEITSRRQYAEQLVDWARDVRRRPAMHLSSAVGLWEGPSQLRQRIAILLDEKLTILRSCSRRWQVAAATLAAAAAVFLSMVTLQPASLAEEEKPAAKSTPDPLSQESLFKLYRKHFKLPEPNVVGGFVVDEKLQPIAQAKVSVYRTNWRDMTQKLIAEKSTDATGKVRFDQVLDLAKEFPGGKIPPDNSVGEELLQVIVRAPGRVTNSHLQPLHLFARRGEPLLIIMPPAATLRGRVTGPNDKPVAGALVSVGTGSLAPWAEAMSARTNADGNYVIDDVPPFDLKSRAEQEAAMRSGKNAAMAEFRALPPLLNLTVEHPDFAVAQDQVEKTPGTRDVQLQPAAILVGRVVLGDSGKPAGGARVWVAGHHQKLSETKHDDAGNNDEQRLFAMSFYTASTRADADGKYRLTSLPTGYYHVSAETPGWVSVGLRDVTAEPGKTNEVPDLTLTKGGTVSIQLIAAKTREPIQVPPEALALIGSSERPIYDRPPMEQRVSANKNGLFELSLPAGKHEIYIGGVYVGEDRKWMSDYTTPTESPNAFVTVTDSKNVQVDMPVSDTKSAKVTRAVIVGPPSVVDQAAALRVNGKPLEAIKLLNAVLDKDPNNIDALSVRADAWNTAGEDRKAIAEYEQILKLKPSGVRKMIAWNNLAFILATSPDDGVRDGKRAVDMAETAQLLQETPTLDVLDTLAAACAEVGQFDRAVKAEKEAIKLAPETQREELRKYLKLYEAHKPRRETRATNDQPADKKGASTSGPKATEKSAQAKSAADQPADKSDGSGTTATKAADKSAYVVPRTTSAGCHCWLVQQCST